MPEGKSHKETAERIAKKYKTEYNEGPGADIKTKKIAVEIETEKTLKDVPRQLQGHRKPVYVAPTTKKGVKKALDLFKDPSILRNRHVAG